MDRSTQDGLLVHVKTWQYRAGEMLTRDDLPPLVRLHVQAALVSIERLAQAILTGR